jgi:hypothetical protein
MMETYGDKVHLFAPRNEKLERGGVIRYLNTGLESWKRSRREDANKQMQHFCAGPYKIIDEGPRSKFGAEMPIGNSVSFEVDQYTYLSFECAKQPAH